MSLEPLPGSTGQGAGDTLDGMSVHCRMPTYSYEYGNAYS